jgi:glycosyltransferase involved in cell wall biosynthesis
MPTKLPISAYIIANNEGDRIAIAIKSLIDWVDEVIVVDSGSTDDTVRVSESNGANTRYNPWPGYGMQKRFAEDLCRNHWLLNLDADEEMTSEIIEEIRQLFTDGEPKEAGFIFQIRDLLPGETVLARGAHTDYRIRLYNRNKGRTEASTLYDPVIIEQGVTRMLASPVLHRSSRSLSHAIVKMNNYTNMQAKNLSKKKILLPYVRLATEFPIAFLKSYFLRQYCLRGARGFAYSIVYAFGRTMRIAKYLEIKKQL